MTIYVRFRPSACQKNHAKWCQVEPNTSRYHVRKNRHHFIFLGPIWRCLFFSDNHKDWALDFLYCVCFAIFCLIDYRVGWKMTPHYDECPLNYVVVVSFSYPKLSLAAYVRPSRYQIGQHAHIPLVLQVKCTKQQDLRERGREICLLDKLYYTMKAPLTFLPRFQKIQKMARRKWMFLYSCKKRLLCWIWRSVNLIRMVRIYCQWWLPKSILLISFSDSVMFFWLENLEKFKMKPGSATRRF